MRLRFRPGAALARLVLLAGLTGLAACGGGDGGTGPDNGGGGGGGDTGTLLTSGTALSGRSGATSSLTLYRIVVPTGATGLLVTTTGGTGDLDLYLRAGQAPTTAAFDCESGGGDNEESCAITNPAAGTWYILLVGYEAYSGVTITATVTTAGGGGGGSGGYTLAVSPANPTIVQGGTAILSVTAMRSGYTGPVALTTVGLPTGVTASGATIADGATSATVTLTASASATTGTQNIEVRGEATGLAMQTATAALTVGTPVGRTVTWTGIGMGYGHACGATTENLAYCWGVRGNGDLGDGSTLNGTITRPSPVSGGLSFAEVFAGNTFTCGRTTANQAYCWGDNGRGQLGIGTTDANKLVPTAVALGTTISQITASDQHTCALTTGGDVYCWGINGNHQVSDQGGVTTNIVYAPTPVATGRSYAQIDVGSAFSCALTSSGGAVWCWGFDNYGIGDGTAGTGSAASYSPPVQAQGGPYTQLAVGTYHVCALTAAGAVYCWGGNSAGEVGIAKPDNNTSLTPTLSPTLVGGGLAFKQVVAGYESTCALTTAGAAYCWGTNFDGDQLGNGGSPLHTATPTAVAGGLVFESLVRTSYKSYCGVTAAGKAYCWGYDNFRQLGSDAATGRTSNVPVPLNNPL